MSQTITVREMKPYMDLISQFPLRIIRSDEELERAFVVIDALTNRLGNLSPLEQDYLDLLSSLVAWYESMKHPIPPLSDGELLRYLLHEKGIAQAELARATGIAVSTICEVLSGDRKLTRAHIGKVAAYFHIEPGVFSFGSVEPQGIPYRALPFDTPLRACFVETSRPFTFASLRHSPVTPCAPAAFSWMRSSPSSRRVLHAATA
jgi:HTH-type transcriptional regulator/antitoxin HigA